MPKMDKCLPLAAVICSCPTYGRVLLKLCYTDVMWLEAPESINQEDGEMDVDRAVYRTEIPIEVKEDAID